MTRVFIRIELNGCSERKNRPPLNSRKMKSDESRKIAVETRLGSFEAGLCFRIIFRIFTPSSFDIYGFAGSLIHRLHCPRGDFFWEVV